jgi:hypothetical protein
MSDDPDRTVGESDVVGYFDTWRRPAARSWRMSSIATVRGRLRRGYRVCLEARLRIVRLRAAAERRAGLYG